MGQVRNCNQKKLVLSEEERQLLIDCLSNYMEELTSSSQNTSKVNMETTITLSTIAPTKTAATIKLKNNKSLVVDGVNVFLTTSNISF